MATLTESSTWTPGVYQLEVTDPVAGGPNGVMNQQAKDLANRTAFLKEHALVSAVGVGAYTPGDLFFASGAAQLARLPIGAARQVLVSDGAQPRWSDALDLPGGLSARGAYFDRDVQIQYGAALTFTAGSVTRPALLLNGSQETELRLGSHNLALRDTVTSPTAGPLLKYLVGYDYTTNTPFKIPLYAWA